MKLLKAGDFLVAIAMCNTNEEAFAKPIMAFASSSSKYGSQCSDVYSVMTHNEAVEKVAQL